MTQGRWIEAFDASRRGWNHTDVARATTQPGQFAAAAAGDASRLGDAVQAQAAMLADGLPHSLAACQVALTLTSLLDGRWDEARMTYLNARRMVEEVGNPQILALAPAGGRPQWLPIISARPPRPRSEAEEYFRARGAEAFVATYRAHAVKAPAVGTQSAARRLTSRSQKPSRPLADGGTRLSRRGRQLPDVRSLHDCGSRWWRPGGPPLRRSGRRPRRACRRRLCRARRALPLDVPQSDRSRRNQAARGSSRHHFDVLV